MGYEIIWVLFVIIAIIVAFLRFCHAMKNQPPPATVIHAPPEETAQLTVHHSGHHGAHHLPQPHEPMRRPSGSHWPQERAPSAPPAAEEDLPPSYAEAVLQPSGMPPPP